jgi:hypothetical protein
MKKYPEKYLPKKKNPVIEFFSSRARGNKPPIHIVGFGTRGNKNGCQTLYIPPLTGSGNDGILSQSY